MTAVNVPFYGRLALVTGGAGGIGQAVCHLLAAEGATVVVADIQLEVAENVARSLPGEAKHQAMYVDVGEPLSVETLFNGIRSAFSEPLSIVVHCAGILRTAPLSQCTDELFDDIIRVELKGTFLVTRAASRDMLRSGTPLSEWRGAIVNISSLAAKCGSMPSCAYAAAKAGVVALTKSAALELAKHGIRCNVVIPGWVETPMMEDAGESSKARVVANTPLKRTAQPLEIAEAIKFLCSPTTSSYITGTVLEVTGGFKM
ncbi:hypothetical protein HPB49_012487 [Dermacentor silvarum]|uniref:Uncharacterized protein n=1 Tax=Dermacentor silvarum TaxID=543639 RepID=A0ACB8D5F7_DERSI|nr:estradiol 17-beta-dehydrogenase 8 [Dermacentor silvarum]KAH7959619.1 hypothetical protein HPB49_012487 [Dermacentor silvarum]